MPLSDHEFQFVCDMVLDRTGVVIEDDKRHFVETQVRSNAGSMGFETAQLLVEHLRSSHYSRLHRQLIEGLVETNTLFFRDFPVFKFMRHEAIPKLLNLHGKDKEINIWCAGCSSGQEAYSISIMVKEAIPKLTDWTVRILGTDISKTLLEKAEKGLYSQDEVQHGLPAALLLRNFTKSGIRWTVNEDHTTRVEFRQMNLVTDEWNELPIFDIIFMRNVLCYFGDKARKTVIGQLSQHMHDDSYLFFGTNETFKPGTGFCREGEEKIHCFKMGEDAPVQEAIPEPVAAGAPTKPATKAKAGDDSENKTKESSSPGQVLVNFQLKALNTVRDIILNDMDPNMHLFLGIMADPPKDSSVFQLIGNIPDWAKKKDSDG